VEKIEPWRGDCQIKIVKIGGVIGKTSKKILKLSPRLKGTNKEKRPTDKSKENSKEKRGLFSALE